MGEMNLPETVQAKDLDGTYNTVPTSGLQWRPSVYALLVHEDKILVIPQQDGRYDIPGGGIEFGEMPEAAVVREVHEETGLAIANPKLVRAASSFFRMPAGQKEFVQTLMLYYTADIVGGELTTDNFDENEKANMQLAQWMTLVELESVGLTNQVDWRPFARQVIQ